MTARAGRDTAITKICTLCESLLFQKPHFHTIQQTEWLPGFRHMTTSGRLKTASEYSARRESHNTPSEDTDQELTKFEPDHGLPLSSFYGVTRIPGSFCFGTCAKSAALSRYPISQARGFLSSAYRRERQPPQSGAARICRDSPLTLPAKSWGQRQELDDAMQLKLNSSRIGQSSPSSPPSDRKHQLPPTRTRAKPRKNNQGSHKTAPATLDATKKATHQIPDAAAPDKPSECQFEDRPQTKDQPTITPTPPKKQDDKTPLELPGPPGDVKSPIASTTSSPSEMIPNTDSPASITTKSSGTPRGWSWWDLVIGKVSKKVLINTWLKKKRTLWGFITRFVSSGNPASQDGQVSLVTQKVIKKKKKKEKKPDKKSTPDTLYISEPSKNEQPQPATVVKQMPRSFRPIGLLNIGTRPYDEYDKSLPPDTGTQPKRPFEAAPYRRSEFDVSYRGILPLESDSRRPRAARKIPSSIKVSAIQGHQAQTGDVFEPLEDKLLLPDEAAIEARPIQYSEISQPSPIDTTSVPDSSLPLTPGTEPVVGEILDRDAGVADTVVLEKSNAGTEGTNADAMEEIPTPPISLQSSQSPEPHAVTGTSITPDLTEDLLLPHEQAAMKGLLWPEITRREQVINPFEIDRHVPSIRAEAHLIAENQVELHQPRSLGWRLTGKMSENDVLKDRGRPEMGGPLIPAHEHPQANNHMPSQQQYLGSRSGQGNTSSLIESRASQPILSPTWDRSKSGFNQDPGDPRKIIGRSKVPTSEPNKASDLILSSALHCDSDDLVLPYESQNVAKEKRTSESLIEATSVQGPNSQKHHPWALWPSVSESVEDKRLRGRPRQYGDLFAPPKRSNQSSDNDNAMFNRSQGWQGDRNAFGSRFAQSHDAARDLFGEGDFWGKSSESRLVDRSSQAVGPSPGASGDAVQILESQAARRVVRRRSNFETLSEERRDHVGAARQAHPSTSQEALAPQEGTERFPDRTLEKFWQYPGYTSPETSVQDTNSSLDAPISPGWEGSATKNEKDPRQTRRHGWRSVPWGQVDKPTPDTVTAKPSDSHVSPPDNMSRVINTADNEAMTYPEHHGGVNVEGKRERGRKRHERFEGRGSRYVDIDQDAHLYEPEKGVKRRDRLWVHEYGFDRDQGRGKRRAESEADEDWEDEWEQYQARKRARIQQREQAELEQKMSGPPQITVPEFIAVEDLARALGLSADELARALVEFGFESLTVKSVLTGETAALVAQEYGFEAKVEEGENRDLKPRSPPDDLSTIPERPPIVTIMGHVDHGKTTMLDYLRKSSIAAQEHGGITQHIGAFVVQMSTGKQITFLDTPGHEAFLAMRQRGAFATDIVVLVVAADDSVKPQTIEALNHAKAAKVPIIVAINKIDKPGAKVDMVKHDLSRFGVEVEDLNGDVPVVCTSGKTGEGMAELEETIVTLSEILDIRAEKDGMAEGWVIEASIKVVGKSAVVLVKRGTLRIGDTIVAGTSWARIRMLRNESGLEIDEAPPGTPAEVFGWSDSLPDAGDEVIQAPDEGKARTAITYREEMKERGRNVDEVARQEQVRREEMANETEQPASNNEAKGPSPKQIGFIIKADVAGSAEAVATTILQIGNQEVQPRVLRSAAGAITEWDIEHAAVSGSIVVNFNMPVAPAIRTLADREGVIIMEHSVIYRLIDDVKEQLSVHLADKITYRVTGEAEVLQIFPINIKGKVFRNYAGCRIRNGSVTTGSRVRVLRIGQNIYESVVDSMRHGKKDVNEMFKNSECGIGVEGFEEFEPGDTIQVYEELREVRRL